MKKIIAAFDGLKFSETTKEYAIYVARTSGTHLVGVFLEDVSYTSYKIYELVGDEGVSVKKQLELDEKDAQTRRDAVQRFEAACRQAGINYSVHHDRRYAINELLHESIYSDLLLINSGETLMHYEEQPPTRFIKHILPKVHCPLILLPDTYRPFEKIIFLYDGMPSSVFAIKIFSYIFQSFNELPAEVLSVKNEQQSLHLPDNKLMKEFMKRHHPHAAYTILKGDASTEIITWLKEQKENILVVLGAYARGKLSRFIDDSMANVIMKYTNLPLFIAHEK